MPQVLLYDDPAFERHLTGAHPESPQLLAAIRAELDRTGLAGRCTAAPTRVATIDELTRIHGADYIDLVRAASAAGGRRLDPDTVASPESFDVARRAAGTALDAVDRVLTGQAPRALCLIRPPGHHALPSRAMGFCLFANVALAAAHARAAHGLERVLIVDWDVHHGNGTQDLFYADGNVHFLSLHRYPFWPGSGAADETGTGAGLGATLNVPLRFGLSRREYMAAFTNALEQSTRAARPQLILLSAGFDAHAADPIGSLGLESEDFGELTQLVCDAASQYCGGMIISLLEGGYQLEMLAESVAVHLGGLLSYGDDRTVH
jgi:acetoin utilization deacetylase AcuC-like enzyme